MTPDSRKHDPRPEYLRELIGYTSLSQREVARRIGISERVMRYYLAPPGADHRPAPYVVQFAIESLAERAIAAERRSRQAQPRERAS